MYEIRMSAGNNLKAWYEGLVGGSDSAAMYVVVYRDKCMINFALQHCTSYLLNLICRCVCVCVGWKKVKQDFEELYKAQVWPVTLLCFDQISESFISLGSNSVRTDASLLFCFVVCDLTVCKDVWNMKKNPAGGLDTKWHIMASVLSWERRRLKTKSWEVSPVCSGVKALKKTLFVSVSLLKPPLCKLWTLNPLELYKNLWPCLLLKVSFLHRSVGSTLT